MLPCRSSIRLLAALLLLLCARLDAVDGIAPVITVPSGGWSLPADLRNAGTEYVDFDPSWLRNDIHWYNATGNPYIWMSLDTAMASPPAGIDNAGIAIIATDIGQAGNGVWEYTLDGSDWSAIPAVSPASALLLPAKAPYRVRFAANDTATAPNPTLTFRAWDGSQGSPGDLLDASAPGSPSCFSAETRMVEIEPVTVNRLPTTSSGGVTLSGGRRGQVWQVSSITSEFSDADNDTVGIAITSVEMAAGQWFFRLDGDPTWTPLDGAIADLAGSGLALLLRPQDELLLLPAQTSGLGFTCRGWDQFALTTPGPASGVGAGDFGDELAVSVTMENHEPYWTSQPGNLPAIDADEASPAWTSLAGLIGPVFGDDDADPQDSSIADPPGMAIVAVDGSGWQWGLDWNEDGLPDDLDENGQPDAISIASGSDASAAILLSGASADGILIRYVPDSQADGGEIRSLTIHAWDQTSSDPDASNPQTGGAFSLGTATISIAVQSVTPPNTLPSVLAVDDTIGVVSQTWEVLVTVRDDDGDSGLGLTVVSPAGVSVDASRTRAVRVDDGITYRTFTVTGAMSSPGDVVVTLRGSDGTASSEDVSFTVSVVAAADTTLASPVTVTASTAANPVYGAIAPGSTANYQALNSAFSDLFPDRARGVWWNGGFRDLPTLPSDTMRQGVLLASTVDRPFSLSSIPRQAAPFAITLPVNSWSLVGVPPLVISASPVTVATSHAWDDFRLENLDGVAQDADAVRSVLEVAYQGGPASTEPFRLDGSSYTRVSTLDAGTAYWIPNYSGTTYRLVRTTASDPHRFGDILSVTAAVRSAAARPHSASATPAQRSGPPAPPAGSSAEAAADGGGGSCGAGGLAGLLIAGLVLLGLRPRRRN